MVDPLISIIVPVYNGEKYLYSLYDSIKRQTFSDYEIIFVDDGSIDNTYNILIKLHRKDSKKSK